MSGSRGSLAGKSLTVPSKPVSPCFTPSGTDAQTRGPPSLPISPHLPLHPPPSHLPRTWCCPLPSSLACGPSGRHLPGGGGWCVHTPASSRPSLPSNTPRLVSSGEVVGSQSSFSSSCLSLRANQDGLRLPDSHFALRGHLLPQLRGPLTLGPRLTLPGRPGKQHLLAAQPSESALGPSLPAAGDPVFPSASVLGARCSVFGAGCSVLGARCWVLGARCLGRNRPPDGSQRRRKLLSRPLRPEALGSVTRKL